jgi:hypothetical protein
MRVIVELGVWGGASLVLWKNQNPNARVIGVDIRKNPLCSQATSSLNSKEIEIYNFDAYSQFNFGNLPDSIDLLIDDGPHTIESQIWSLKYLSKLSEKGTFVIEDIQNPAIDLPLLLDAIPSSHKDRYVFMYLERVKGRYDDVALVISNDKNVINSLLELQDKYDLRPPNYFFRTGFPHIFFRSVHSLKSRWKSRNR